MRAAFAGNHAAELGLSIRSALMCSPSRRRDSNSRSAAVSSSSPSNRCRSRSDALLQNRADALVAPGLDQRPRKRVLLVGKRYREPHRHETRVLLDSTAVNGRESSPPQRTSTAPRRAAGKDHAPFTRSRRETYSSRAAIPASVIGGRSGNSATRFSFPPIASTYPLSVDISRSLRCSMRDTFSWLIPSLSATPGLGLVSRLAQIPKRHLFGNQRVSRLLDSLPAIFGKRPHFLSECRNLHSRKPFLHRRGHRLEFTAEGRMKTPRSIFIVFII